MKQGLFLTFLLFFCIFSGICQEDSTDHVLPFEFKLDPVMITAVKSGFRVEDFVKRVQEDKSFQEGFKNLRRYANTASNKIEMLDKKGKIELSVSLLRAND